jgi:voltage-gated potassium channel Kch
MTMALTPFLDVISTRVANRLDGAKGLDMEDGLQGEAEHHVLIAGFGRVGETVALMLKNSDVSYLALDINAKAIESGRARGFHAFYGDASKASVLQAAGAGHAKLVVVTMDNREAAERTVSTIRYLYPGLAIQARTFDLAHSDKLLSLGANFTVPEHVEVSLQLGREALLHLGHTESYANDLAEDIRQNDYAVLRRMAEKEVASPA